MKFGKQIQAQQIPGWSAYYLDYKFLKKIISSLAANRPASEAAALASGIRPSDLLNPPSNNASSPHELRIAATDSPGRPPIFTASDHDEDRSPEFRAHKAAFFFKLERELEKINGFYLQNEAELKLRLETLLSKRRAAAMRGLPDPTDGSSAQHVEWTAVEEGFRLLERDLGKLQQFIEINGTGFRKILKKFDKHATSTTKELYLTRQVDVQPVFNRQLIAELADTVTSCRADLTNLSAGLKFENTAANDFLTQEILQERLSPTGPLRNFESKLHSAIAGANSAAVVECVHFSEALTQQTGSHADIARILWNVIIEAPPDIADLILASLSHPFDFSFVDDINGRTCLHKAAIAGALQLVNLCLDNGVQADKVDVYGRTALHYASMHGHASVCRRLLQANVPPDTLDRDNYTPLVYGIMKGSVECVRVLLDEGTVSIQAKFPTEKLQPLSMASQSGYVDVVVLLLERGAESLPNTNGEYPMHLAAREGHADVCKLLLTKAGWDTPDRYYEWTPLFHAARYGHYECVRVLLEAGARVFAIDEHGHTAAHYAGWYGHYKCLELLVQNSNVLPPTIDCQVFEKSPDSDAGHPSADLDQIPPITLPPPIMPHRVYGHNYLDKTHLVRITIGPPSQKNGQGRMGVCLQHRSLSPALRDEDLASAPLRLVMTTGTEANPAPYTVSLPQKNDKEVFMFQIASLDQLFLEFSICPAFGTKTIGRAVALPSMFNNVHNTGLFTIPLLGNRLNVVGEVGFEICIIKAFKGVTLEIGGDIETYWKSIASIVSSPPKTSLSRSPHIMPALGSTQSSPSVFSNHGINALSNMTFTIASLQGQYIKATVQVTKDLEPVVFSDWLLPSTDFDLCVCDVTLAQFESLAARLGRGLEHITSSLDDLTTSLPRAMVSLSSFFDVLPQEFGVILDLAYPPKHVSGPVLSRNQLDLNTFVDSVLKTIYQVSAPPEAQITRKRIAFSSFLPDVCAFLNWKQPNYPVFFYQACGKAPHFPCGSASDECDDRSASLYASVEFAKSNNLLGLFVDATLLIKVPSLIHSIRDTGLLVGVHGKVADHAELISASRIDGTPVDAYFNGNLVVFVDNATRDLI